MVKSNALINCWPHYPPWGSGWGRVGIWVGTPPLSILEKKFWQLKFEVTFAPVRK